MNRTAVLLSLLLIAAAGAGAAEVEWFIPGRVSEILIDTSAAAGNDRPPAECTFATTAGIPCWSAACLQKQARCKPASLSGPMNLAISEQAQAVQNSGEGRYHVDVTTTSKANQTTHFGDLSVRSSNAVATDVANRGTWQALGRGTVVSSGDVYFRITGKDDLLYELKGSIQPIGIVHNKRGLLQLIPLPNTGAGGDTSTFSFTSISAKSTDLAAKGRLRPGVYRLNWWTMSDVINSSGAASLDFDLNFEPGRPEFCPIPPQHSPAEARNPLPEPIITFTPYDWSDSEMWWLYWVGTPAFRINPTTRETSKTWTDLGVKANYVYGYLTFPGGKKVDHVLQFRGTNTLEYDPSRNCFATTSGLVGIWIENVKQAREIYGVQGLSRQDKPKPGDRVLWLSGHAGEVASVSPTGQIEFVCHKPGIENTKGYCDPVRVEDAWKDNVYEVWGKR